MRVKQAWKKVNRLDNFPMLCSDTIPHLQLLQRLLRERGNNILAHFIFHHHAIAVRVENVLEKRINSTPQKRSSSYDVWAFQIW